jgi:hypothetical protein
MIAQVLMNGLLEGVSVITQFILRRVIVVWVVIALAQVIANLGK